MKKTVLIVSLASLLLATGSAVAFSQDKPKPKKDTVNMDTNAKPTQYYAVEDEKTTAKGGSGSTTQIAIIAAAAVVVIGGILFFTLRKKKKE